MKKKGPKVSEGEQQVPGALQQPWRNFEKDFEWNEKYLEKLLDDIRKHEIGEEHIESIRILLIGQIKAGKSSFINTVSSIDKGRVTQITRSGGANCSLTSGLKEYKPQKRLKNICILDTMGLEEDLGGLNVKDILQLVDGHVPKGYKFNPASSIQAVDPSYMAKPQQGDRVQCVVFVVDANILGQDNVSDATRRKIKSVNEELKNKDIATFVLITKIDVLCELVEKDVTKTFHSEKVKKAVDVAGELYNVQTNNIFVVKNYECEIERIISNEILVMLALRQIMYVGTDFLNEATTSEKVE